MTPHPPPDLGTALVCDSPEAAADVAAGHIVQAAKVAVHERGRFLLALCGGSTPEYLYRLLAGPEYDALIDWPSTHLLWGDERCVGPDDPRSNYGLVQRCGLLRRRVAGVHRMEGERDPVEAAADYEVQLRALAGKGEPFRLDMALLGLGADGHTASLFPNTPPPAEGERLVVATAEHGGVRRLTMTRPALGAARRLLYLVTGDKAEAVVSVFTPGSGLPAAQVAARAAKVTWILDDAAAALVCRPATL